MAVQAVEDYLRAEIPLAAGMDTRVVAAGEAGMVLEAPLGPNRNHHDTAFGGSVATLAILAGFAWVHFRLEAEGIHASTVIQRSQVRYDAPARDTLRAEVTPPSDASWARFIRALSRFGRGRVRLEVAITAGGGAVARFEGAYVAKLVDTNGTGATATRAV